ncbi:DUF4156 domain containing protein [Lysobacter dokdonensis DS-58]|uniref:DUF4156 domain containing protein n=1 Tax=Lysobacter dokdonensis DS-58 TaxID=1300345 RepID=A0A0A2WFG0_9GAMM|nr:DUF4142 domain-containing protein [Lysobacter dokdonensis]KGQ18488.1 DUF4156 domain containing protein [Lysobacter dokdonensis DS-58]
MTHGIRTTLLSTIVATACAAALPAAMAQEAVQRESRDSTALSVLATVDQDEIDAAKLALKKGVTGEVKVYAEMMVRDHTANLSATTSLSATPNLRAPSLARDGAVDLQKKADAALMAKLTPLEGKAFEKAYIDGMVEGHAQVLAKLDNELLPKARDAKVKAHLTKTRAAVSMHLDHARKLQGQR